jgi:hypothetical protein
MLDEIKSRKQNNEAPIVVNACDPANPYGVGVDLHQVNPWFKPKDLLQRFLVFPVYPEIILSLVTVRQLFGSRIMDYGYSFFPKKIQKMSLFKDFNSSLIIFEHPIRNGMNLF